MAVGVFSGYSTVLGKKVGRQKAAVGTEHTQLTYFNIPLEEKTRGKIESHAETGKSALAARSVQRDLPDRGPGRARRWA